MRALGGVLAILILVGAAVTESVAAAEETRLIDQFGRPVDAREFAGHWLLVVNPPAIARIPYFAS